MSTRAAVLFAAWCVGACSLTAQVTSNMPPAVLNVPAETLTNGLARADVAREIQAQREWCIEHRRQVCGKVMLVLPDGLVVDSGYLGLQKPEFRRSWLVRGNAVLHKTPDYLEENVPGAVCTGLVFISNIPKKPVVKQYDYISLAGYPDGMKTYTSVGTVQHTVRKFSAMLVKAVDANLLSGLTDTNHTPVK